MFQRPESNSSIVLGIRLAPDERERFVSLIHALGFTSYRKGLCYLMRLPAVSNEEAFMHIRVSLAEASSRLSRFLQRNAQLSDELRIELDTVVDLIQESYGSIMQSLTEKYLNV